MKVKKLRPETKTNLKKAVKNVQKVLKKREVNVEKEKQKNSPQNTTEELPETELKYNVKRGIVGLSHIPHGFYEEQMESYFQQFGKVTRVRLVRSKKTGKSRGYGYIEFAIPEVAKIAAETMNNYLMCGRLLKATYIPPEKQHFGFFFGKNWSGESYPKLENRKNEITSNRAIISKSKHNKFVKKSLNKLSMLEKKLKAKGINFKFAPVDVSNTV